MGSDSKPVVVGIDGSRAALNAVRWAVAEAEYRDAPLRLIHAVPGGQRSACPDPVLSSAELEVTTAGRPVRFESARIVGDAGEVLVAESSHSHMVCIGVPSRDRLHGRLFGPTAAALAVGAHCPVALIRSDSSGSTCDAGVVSVVLDDEPDNDALVHLAMQEGRLRDATVRQVDRRLNSWIRRFPDVHVETIAAGSGRAYSESHQSRRTVQLAVVGQADAEQITELEVPNCHPILGYPDCSVLLVRH
ncbi:MAG: universal stress protein [Mycobacterium sp.]|nr:universal stress protein [Mycobacterium sp.]